MVYRIRGGLRVAVPGAPVQAISPGQAVRSVGVFGADYPGMRTEILVAQGDSVAAGDALLRDRHRPEIRVVSPVAGHVARIERGAKRRLSILEVIADGDAAHDFAVPDPSDSQGMRRLLQEAGLWTAFVQRPFGHIPDPAATPAAIFVNAAETLPLAAEPTAVLDRDRDMLAAGLDVLLALTEGPVFFCQGDGPALADPRDRLRVERFSGAHPAGLVGTHIDRLMPVARTRSVWQAHYQDVAAIGRLIRTGRISGRRVVALGGPGMRAPRLVEAPDGASFADLLDGELRDGPKTILSGDPIGGRASSHLRRRHWQVGAMDRPAAPRRALNWFQRHERPERRHPVVPTAAVENALGPRLPVMPLIRALTAGDVETAQRLGAEGLLEEDMALLTYATGGAEDFGALLRQTLDQLEAQA